MYKETAKWLLTFVPIPTFVVLALSLAPRYEAISRLGLHAWICANPAPASAFLLAAIAAIAITVACSFVLLAAPNLDELLDDDPKLSDAFSKHGVGEPVFPDATAFKEMGKAIRTKPDEVPAWKIGAYHDTTERLKGHSEELSARLRFTVFVWVLVLGGLVLFGGLSVATATMPASPEPITTPTKVAVFAQPDAESKLRTEIECANPAAPATPQTPSTDAPPAQTSSTEALNTVTIEGVTAIAVGGTWDHPKIRLIGPGCKQDLWTPSDDLKVVFAPA